MLSSLKFYALRWQRELAAVTAGALLPFAFAPFEIWLLSIVCPGCLAIVLFKSTAIQSFRRSLLFGIGLYGVGVSWVFVSIAQFGETSPQMAVVLTTLFVLLLAVFFALPFYFYGKYLSQSYFGFLLGFPAIWVLNEWIKSWIFTGFPWLYVGYAGIDTPLSSLAPLFGVFGMSMALVLTATALCAFWFSQNNVYPAVFSRKNTVLFPPLIFIIFIWVICGAASFIKWTKIDDKPISVGIAQANIPQEKKWLPEFAQPSIDIFRELSHDLWQHDWVIWPEAAIPYLHSIAEPLLDQIDVHANNTNTVFITGVIYDDPMQNKYYNSIVARGLGEGRYYKQRLVPFGEYVPLENYLRGLIHFFDLPTSYIHIGPKLPQKIDANGSPIAVSICYEIVYPDLIAELARDSSVLITISNDAWFGDSKGPIQHFQMARLRAVETGRYLIRATNNGITAFVDPKGNVITAGGRFTREAITGEVFEAKGRTPYMVWGSVPIVLICLIIILSIARYNRYIEKTKLLTKSTQKLADK